MWREHFNADPKIVGRVIRLNSAGYAVVGVLPEAFQFTLLGRVQVWRPLAFTPEVAANRRGLSIVGLGRLRQGSSVEQARDELSRIANDLATSYPETNANRRVRALGLAEEVRRHHDLGFIVPVIFAMVGCVLLIACPLAPPQSLLLLRSWGPTPTRSRSRIRARSGRQALPRATSHEPRPRDLNQPCDTRHAPRPIVP